MWLSAQGISLVLIYLQTQPQSRKGDWEILSQAQWNSSAGNGWVLGLQVVKGMEKVGSGSALGRVEYFLLLEWPLR